MLKILQNLIYHFYKLMCQILNITIFFINDACDVTLIAISDYYKPFITNWLISKFI